MRQYFHTHKRFKNTLLACVLCIIETCCPEIKSINGYRLSRSFFTIDFITQ